VNVCLDILQSLCLRGTFWPDACAVAIKGLQSSLSQSESGLPKEISGQRKRKSPILNNENLASNHRKRRATRSSFGSGMSSSGERNDGPSTDTAAPLVDSSSDRGEAQRAPIYDALQYRAIALADSRHRRNISAGPLPDSASQPSQDNFRPGSTESGFNAYTANSSSVPPLQSMHLSPEYWRNAPGSGSLLDDQASMEFQQGVQSGGVHGYHIDEGGDIFQLMDMPYLLEEDLYIYPTSYEI
jgi:hypothetical protein